MRGVQKCGVSRDNVVPTRRAEPSAVNNKSQLCCRIVTSGRGGAVIGQARPTMNDVARTAGVSLKTVSRVVNGETTVAPDLAARVRAAVESLNYRPHLGASMLRRNDRRTRTIGVLLEDVGNPFSSTLHRAIEDEARLRDVHVLTGSLDEDPERERALARAFAQRQADGL